MVVVQVLLTALFGFVLLSLLVTTPPRLYAHFVRYRPDALWWKITTFQVIYYPVVCLILIALIRWAWSW